MAKYDPMDLKLRSQEFYRDFYRFHKKSCDVWYIKDANHRYVDASHSFLSRFLPPESTGLPDSEVVDLLNEQFSSSDMISKFETEVFLQKKDITIFTWQYFIDNRGVQAFIVDIKPMKVSGELMAVFYVNDLFNCNIQKRHIVGELLCGGKFPDLKDNIVWEMSDEQLSVLTQREWEVAWLAIYGKSQRWIAEFLNIKRQAVERKLKTVYLKLRVFDLSGLILLSEKNEWFAYLPPAFVSENYSCFSI